LSQQMPHIAPWDSLFAEANQSLSVHSLHGRIQLHVLFELVYDFFPNFNYNSITQRFVRAPSVFHDNVTRDVMPKPRLNFYYGSKPLTTVFLQLAQLTREFVGVPHLRAIIDLVGQENLLLIVTECLSNLEIKVTNVLAPYLQSLIGGMPPSSKLPISDYGTKGGLGYFQAKLADIMEYPDLRNEVYNHFKEFGNTIVFLNLLDLTLMQTTSQDFLQVCPFLGVTPSNYSPSGSRCESVLFKSVSAVVSAIKADSTLHSTAPVILDDLVQTANRIDDFYRKKGQTRSFFKAKLKEIDRMLDSVRDEWSGLFTRQNSRNGVESLSDSVDTSTEFYRVWSSLQFVYCLPRPAEQYSCQDDYGDGLLWAGAVIIYLLHQQHRFNVFDFSYHIANIEQANPIQNDDNFVREFLKNVNAVRDLNNQIFEILKVYYPLPSPKIVPLHPIPY